MNQKSEIEENLKRVENGEALTIPLIILNGKFKEEYRKRYGEFEKFTKEERLERIRKQKPEVQAHIKAYKKAYNQKPEIKERMRKYQQKYYQKPEVKERMRKYYQKPEVKEKARKYKQKYYLEHKELK